jgi:hypothetical protein
LPHYSLYLLVPIHYFFERIHQRGSKIEQADNTH